MSWKKFEELDREYPETIVQKKIIGFENATDGLADLAIVRLSDIKLLSSEVSGDFKFDLILYSNVIKQYKFKILSFGYGITLAPIYYRVEDSISDEISDGDRDLYNFLSSEKKVDTVEDFAVILEKIFQSKAFDLVVRGLIKIAKKNVE